MKKFKWKEKKKIKQKCFCLNFKQTNKTASWRIWPFLLRNVAKSGYNNLMEEKSIFLDKW